MSVDFKGYKKFLKYFIYDNCNLIILYDVVRSRWTGEMTSPTIQAVCDCFVACREFFGPIDIKPRLFFCK